MVPFAGRKLDQNELTKKGRRISTIAGKKRDTSYKLIDGKWQAFVPAAFRHAG